MVHSASFALTAERRPESSHTRGANRRLRRADQIPGVLYGKHLKTSIPLVLDAKTLIRSLADEAFHSHLLQLTVDGTTHTVVLRATQRKHGKTHSVLHVDFQQVDAKEKISMHVPLHVEGADLCEPLVRGQGIMTKMLAEVQVRCLPSDLPEFLCVNIAKAQLHDAIHLSDITFPPGVESVDLSHGEQHDLLVLSIHERKMIQEPEPDVATPGTSKNSAEGAASQAKNKDAS